MSAYIVNVKSLSRRLLSKAGKLWSLIGFEALAWIIGLAYLLFVHTPGEEHLTICPLYNLGFKFCPGCGLGNSISYIFKGDFITSFQSHPLGFLALIIITLRIISIIKNNRRIYA